MEVILLQRIEKLGQIGDIVSVKAGYARNYLIPNNKCLRATEENKQVFETKKAELELQNLNLKKEAESVSLKVEGFNLILIKNAGESGQLYGSVKAQDISKSLTESGYSIHKSQIIINDVIKSLGVYKIKLALHPEISSSIILNIARSQDEAEGQLKSFLKEKSKASKSLSKEEEENAIFENFEKIEELEKKANPSNDIEDLS